MIFGATSAIAVAVERMLATNAQSSFFLVARHVERLELLAADLRTRGASVVEIAAADLDDTGAHESLIKDGLAALGGLDLALIAHGVLGDQQEAEVDYRAAEKIFHTNLLSAVSLVTLLGNHCESQGNGCIAVLSSVAGDRGRQSNYVYGASKAGLTTFLSGVRNRLDRKGLHILTIKPGFVTTPMTAHMDMGRLAATPQSIARGIIRAIQYRRDVVYLPSFWRVIMLLIRAVPETLFKRTNT
jgi:decaprenylphospho-beta-D-erythro-pentofuranosid-2-ulose 2-reductase